MMYSEFVENTGCKDNECNRNIFKRLEIVYMNDDTCTKEWVYEAGKKLVDNSLSEEQKENNKKIKRHIEENNALIKDKKEEIERCNVAIECEKNGSNEKWWIDTLKSNKKFLKEEIKSLKTENSWLRGCIIK